MGKGAVIPAEAGIQSGRVRPMILLGWMAALTHINTNDINSVSLREAERRSNPKQRRDCRALRARNDCNGNFFVWIRYRARKGEGGSKILNAILPGRIHP
jgi:hypothetical protein